jgi:hypothetical protein
VPLGLALSVGAREALNVPPENVTVMGAPITLHPVAAVNAPTA